MATAASNKTYLISQAKLLPKEQQTAAIQKINNAGTITKDKLESINLSIETVLYGKNAQGGTAGAKPGTTSVENPVTTPVVDPYAAINTQNRVNWKEVLKTTLTQWGLPTLIPKIQDYIDQGYTADTATLMIQNEPEYKTRFAGNTARVNAGLAPLDPATYLSNETSYAAAMRAAGLPAGFYDDPAADFSTYIGNNVSPAELQSRIGIAADILDGTDPMITDQLQSYYGLDKGTMLAHILDPKAAMPFVQRQVDSAKIGTAAARQNMNIGVGTAESLQNLGVTQQQANQGFQQIAEKAPNAQRLSSIYNQEQGYGQEQAIAETFGGAGGADAALRRKRLSSLEQAQFSGSSGTGKSSFAQQNTGQI
jgi:hypothetical protein